MQNNTFAATSRVENTFTAAIVKYWIVQEVPSERLLLIAPNEGTRPLVPAFLSQPAKGATYGP